MRTSKKEHVLRSAMTIVEKQGLAALTYESLAAESGLSKGSSTISHPGKHYCSKSTGFWPHNGKKKWWN
ncbi:hypothetical protein [Corynebacterium matruchotii]|uniref:TetR/AcrR family transcriptional regulator n=1 Tax=Corynebacterium matruchotii TaxID=43768 RepID=UPI0028EA3968|nr:hypothetical protein [Corynebacterium matruchotii]